MAGAALGRAPRRVARGGLPGRQAAPHLGRLAGLLGYHLRRAQVSAFQDFARTMAAFDIAPGQLGALLLIEANPGLKQSELGRALGIDRSSVVPLIDKLEARGLVRRDVRSEDRRAHALALAPAGAVFLRRLLPQLQRHERRIAGGLSKAERSQLIALLSRIGVAGSTDGGSDAER